MACELEKTTKETFCYTKLGEDFLLNQDQVEHKEASLTTC